MLVKIIFVTQLIHLIEPLPSILIVGDSGFRITAISPGLKTMGLSKVNFKGDIDENFAALTWRPTFTRHI